MDDLANKFKNKLGFGNDRQNVYGQSSSWHPQYPTQPPLYGQPPPPPPPPNYASQPHSPYAPQQPSPYYPTPQHQYHAGYTNAPPPVPTRPSPAVPAQSSYSDFGEAPSYASVPPPPVAPRPQDNSRYNRQEPSNVPPPMVKSDTRPSVTPQPPDPSVSRSTGSVPQAAVVTGTLYKPGEYPTPDLFPFPLSKHRVLTHPSSFTSAAIQQAIDELGPHSTLYLPPRTRWTVSSTIHLKPHQELATLGYPTEETEIAWLEAEEGCSGNVLKAFDMPGVRIRNVGFDGGREKYGAENIRVTNNRLGPAGYDEDAEDGGHWADGISYAAQNGLVAGNLVEDATDGGIVIFGAPGTLVTSNTIITRTRMGLGAINMVDYGPHDGNYLGTRVINNTIRIEGSYLKIGIGQGPSVWFTPPNDKPREYIRGAVVKRNLITGPAAKDGGQGRAGYGFPVSDVEDWICTENEVSSNVVFGGDMSEMSRDPRHISIGPGPFVKAIPREGQGPKSSEFQHEFVEGPIARLIAIRPGAPRYQVFWPGQIALRIGDSIALQKIRLAFDTDGEVRLRIRTERGDEVLWEAECKNHVRGRHDARLVFEQSSGHLDIVDGAGHVLFDLTPHLIHPLNTAVALSLSDERPHLVLSAIESGSVLWAPTGYEVGYQWSIGFGPLVYQTAPRYTHIFVAGLNPLGQYVVLKSIGHPLVGPIMSWPPDESMWCIVWKSHEVHNQEDDSQSRIIFQGDGNLVIYSGREHGRALWASGSCGRQPPATRLRWTDGEAGQGLLSCMTDEGQAWWSSQGKTVG
ncbi:hypothetical protein FRC04_006584 [Tulasnella sp. 424]|nr:hypothetical protein FRC04_006584 [Tulasnella sp. 424]